VPFNGSQKDSEISIHPVGTIPVTRVVKANLGSFIIPRMTSQNSCESVEWIAVGWSVKC
jgi:hypothetical protein